METRERRRKKNADILEYVYAELEIKEEDQIYLKDEWGINDVRKLRNLNEDDWGVIVQSSQGTTRRSLVRQLKHLVAWMRIHTKEEFREFLETLEGWKLYFTEDILNDFEYDSGSIDTNIIEKDTGNDVKTRSQSRKMLIRMSDYPEFDGTGSSWPGVKEKFEALLEAQGLDELLRIDEVQEHKLKLSLDKDYEQDNHLFYSILKNSCAKGLAKSKIKSFKEHRDGALAWKVLKEYYDQDGDKESFGTQALEQLLNLRLMYNSHGGFDRYMSKFEQYCSQLDDAEQPLSESQKRQIFLKGIDDRDYSATKDLCANMGYNQTINSMRKKAVQLGKAGTTKVKQYRRANQTRRNGGGPRDGNNRQQSRNGNNDKKFYTPYIPKEVWDKMAPEVRKAHIEASKRGRTNQESYGSQYSGKEPSNDQQRNQKQSTTSKEDNDNNDNNSDNKDEQDNKFESNQLFGFKPREQKMHKSIEDTRYVDRTKMYAKKKQGDSMFENKADLAYVDNASDTVGIGGKAWIIEEISDRTVTIAGYDNCKTIQEKIKIGNGVTATTLPDGETILLRVYEATLLGEKANTLLSTLQMRENFVNIDDRPKRHGGKSLFEKDGIIVPLTLTEGMMTLDIRKPSDFELNTCEVIEITKDEIWNPQLYSEEAIDEQEYNQLVSEFEDKRNVNVKLTSKRDKTMNIKEYSENFLFPGDKALAKTFDNTTQLGRMNLRIPMRRHVKSRNPILQRRRINEPYATDTWFSTTTSYEGYNCVQLFYGTKSRVMSNYGLTTESDGPNALLDFFRQEGVPISITRDNSKMQSSIIWNDYMRRFWVKDRFIEPHNPQQNPVEREAMGTLKEKLARVMIDTGCDNRAWFRAACHVADVHNHTASERLGWATPIEVRDGITPDITLLTEFKFWDEIYYYEDENNNMKEERGRWLGRAHNYGDNMCSWVLTEATGQIIVRSMIRHATNTGRKNITLDKEAQKHIENLDQMGECPIISYQHIQGEAGLNEKQEFKRAPKVYQNNPLYVDPDDLIDLYIQGTFTSKKGKEYKKRGRVVERVSDDTYRVEFPNGKQRVYEYAEIVAMANKADDDGEERWTFENIVDHRWSPDPDRKGKLDVLIKWQGYEDTTWEPMEMIKTDDPVTLAKYAETKGLLEQSKWKWARRYVKNKKKQQRMLRNIMKAKRRKTGIKYQFGVRVPRTPKEALELDAAEGNTYWADAMKKEKTLIVDEYNSFREKETDEDLSDYQYIPLLWAFAVKYDGRRRARLVAGGHVTDDLEYDIYSGNVDLETVRIAFLARELYDLDVIAADVASAYLQALTCEKVYTIAGPEFGSEWEGKILIIVKALYGLKASGGMWHQKLADNLRSMGFRPCQADFDLWIRPCDNHYEYIAVITDDLLLFTRNPAGILCPLKEVYGYELKGVGKPEYYNGGDVGYDKEQGKWFLGARTFIKNTVEKIEKLLEITMKNYGSPMETGDHPEVDDTDLLYGTDITMYQMLIGCAQWAVTLGRYDVQYATNTLARFGSAPREGHIRRAIRIFGYLKHNNKGRILFDIAEPDTSRVEFKDNDWIDLYPDAEEAIPANAPLPMNDRKVRILVIMDASHAADLATRRSVTGFFILVGKTIIKWYSKRQNTVETSMYGSELVALRLAIETLIEVRYKLRMMGIAFYRQSYVLCDNKSVVLNMQLPSSSLKKKHNSVAYHKCREAVAAGIAVIGHIEGKQNISDILTKPLGPADYYKFLSGPLFGKRGCINHT